MFCAAIIPSIALMAYWTCQFTSSWVCRGLPRFERSYVSVCAHTEHQHRVYDDAFSRQQNTFHPKRGFLLDGARDVKKADAGLGAVPTCAGDQGLWAWVERRRVVWFWVVSFKWGDSYKKHTSRTEPPSQGQTPVRQPHVEHCSVEHRLYPPLPLQQLCHQPL